MRLAVVTDGEGGDAVQGGSGRLVLWSGQTWADEAQVTQLDNWTDHLWFLDPIMLCDVMRRCGCLRGAGSGQRAVGLGEGWAEARARTSCRKSSE